MNILKTHVDGGENKEFYVLFQKKKAVIYTKLLVFLCGKLRKIQRFLHHATCV
jgi:hypothetical protein